jgi:hypothetical protein
VPGVKLGKFPLIADTVPARILSIGDELRVQMATLPRREPDQARWQFSLRTVLVLALVCTVLLAIVRIVPPVGILIVGALPAFFCTCRIIQAIRHQSAGLLLPVATLVSWCLAYIVSLGPAVAFEAWLGNWTAPGVDALELFYAPLIWLHDNAGLSEALGSYVDQWENHVDGRILFAKPSAWVSLSTAFAMFATILVAIAITRGVCRTSETESQTRRLHFSLRSLLLLVTISAIAVGLMRGIGTWHYAQQREHRGRVEISKLGGTYSMNSAIRSQQTGRVPGWIFRTFRNHVAHVDLSQDAWPIAERRAAGQKVSSVVDSDLAVLHWFTRLRSLDLHGSDVGDGGVQSLEKLRHLEELDLADTKMTETGVAKLRSVLPGCRIHR